MSVKIEFTGKCKNCQIADLELECDQLESFSGDDIHLWHLRCKHEEVCERWNQILNVDVQNGLLIPQ